MQELLKILTRGKIQVTSFGKQPVYGTGDRMIHFGEESIPVLFFCGLPLNCHERILVLYSLYLSNLSF